jgi:lipocalin
MKAFGLNYTLNNDGTIHIDNSCRLNAITSPFTTVSGKATIPDRKHPGFLKINLGLSFIPAPYAVVDTDYDNYAIVVSCPRLYTKGFIWILTRQQQIDLNFVETLKNRTADMGFSLADMTKTYQGPECNSFTHDDTVLNN